MMRHKVRRIFDLISTGFNWVAVFMIIFMVISTILDVLLRMMDSPLPGIFELNEASMGIAVFSAMSYTWIKGGHIRVELLVNRFSGRLKVLSNIFATLVGFLVFALIAWRTWIWAIYSMRMSETTDILHMPIAPVKFMVSVASALMCLRMLVSIFDILAEGLQN